MEASKEERKHIAHENEYTFLTYSRHNNAEAVPSNAQALSTKSAGAIHSKAVLRLVFEAHATLRNQHRHGISGQPTEYLGC